MGKRETEREGGREREGEGEAKHLVELLEPLQACLAPARGCERHACLGVRHVPYPTPLFCRIRLYRPGTTTHAHTRGCEHHACLGVRHAFSRSGDMAWRMRTSRGGGRTEVPRSQKIAPCQNPTVGLCLGPYGGSASGAPRACRFRESYLTECVQKAVLQKSIPAQIRASHLRGCRIRG